MNFIPVKLKSKHILLGQRCYMCNAAFNTEKPIAIISLSPNSVEQTIKDAKLRQDHQCSSHTGTL